MGIRHFFLALLIASLALATGPAAAQQPTNHVIIKAGHLLDVKTGKTLANQAIVIEGDNIVSIGPVADLKVSPGDNVIDLSQATVLPGLIDAHTHLTGDPKNLGYQSLGISIPREALIGARNARVTLEAGFTTVRNVGASGFSDVALREAINAGDVPGPRLLVSGPPLTITGGHADNNLLPFEYPATSDGAADRVDGVRHMVRQDIKYGADLIKFMASGGVLSKGDNPQTSQYTQDEMRSEKRRVRKECR